MNEEIITYHPLDRLSNNMFYVDSIYSR